MFMPCTDSWGQVRQTFADQFEPDGAHFIYRRSQKGEAFRVSSADRNRFLEGFDRNLSRAKWLIYVGLTVVLGVIILLSVRQGTDLSQIIIFAGIGLVMIPYYAYFRWAWAEPARELAGRTPVAGERPPEEVRRLRFRRMTYGQLAGAAFGGLVIPFIGSSHQDVFSGWNRLWLVFGGMIVMLAAVQAFRKWQFEQESSLKYAFRPSSYQEITQPTGNVGWRSKSQLGRYLLIGAIVLALAFTFLTPAGKRLTQAPSFWPIVMIGCGGWSLVTVAQGYAKGRIEPFARGFYNTYERETQPKRYWASMGWNSIFGCLCLWLAFIMNEDATERSLQDRCYDERGTYSVQQASDACNQLVKLQPKDSDAYLNRGLILLDSGKLDQAVVDFTRAHELDPASPWPLANRGISYALMNDRERAEKDFEAVRTMDPTNPALFRGEALLNMEAGKLEAAIISLSAQLARDPADAWSLRTRADAYQQLGDFEKARADRDKLLQLSKGSN
jgi:Flp pilus assembly protein TadD